MMRVFVFCEGQSEESFVKNVLYPHFQSKAIYLTPIVLSTRVHFRGGVSTYGKIHQQIERKCKEDNSAWVTTMIDYYGLPHDWPDLPAGKKQITQVEKAFEDRIGMRNFLANLILHEFEGLLFSNPEAFSSWFKVSEVDELKSVRSSFSTPEDINDNRETAPSKRLKSICKNYDKTFHGFQLAQEIGLEKIRRECPHFDGWIKRLEALSGERKS